jgi:hypothetical protein
MKKLITIFAVAVLSLCCTIAGVSALPETTNIYNGNANGDGYLDIRDVTIIQKYVAKIVTESDIKIENADYNGDGEINVADATAIQHFLVENGYVEFAPVEETTTTTEDDNVISLPMVPID